MAEMKLIDLRFSSPKYTWKRTRNNSLVQEWLDQGLLNDGWQVRWPSTSVSYSVVKGSDHCPIFVTVEPLLTKSKKVFRFEAFWAKDERCKEIVDRSWSRVGGASTIDRWLCQLNSCKGNLVNWSRRRFKCAREEIEAYLNRLMFLQED